MFGSHLSIAGGMENALIKARELDMDCVQVFTKNQRQWRVPPLRPEQIAAWRDYQQTTGITRAVSHDSYLINLASPDPAARDKSIGLYREELTRCEQLGIGDLVMHPGAHMNAGDDAGLGRVVDAFDQLHAELPGLNVVTCVEITAGQGTALGHRLEHLAWIIDHVADGKRVGVCLDTAHLLAAGYDLTSAAGARRVLKEVEGAIGLSQVRVLHVNDSKTARGSRVDRHEHIGHGHVALAAFEVIVNEPAFVDVPKIMETPKAEAPDGRAWDTVNIEVLRGLLKKKGRGRTRTQGA
ncbi:MAG: deoxyribonuclease IV [Phycisphaeraceae bacterium]